jgi:hypothetical protein
MPGTENSDKPSEASGRADDLSNRLYLGRPGSNVGWARWGIWSRLIASALRTRRPAVLILTLPRCGSSWVGSILGRADDALYLREPVTQSDPAITRRITFDPSEHPELEPTFRRLADMAFLGLPAFKDVVIYDPEQWSLADRLRRRVVIKEVNARACQWFLNRYQPRVVFLVRHPAAVAWSSQKQGWLGPTPADWEKRGGEHAESLALAWEALKPYRDCEVASYESLCSDPLAGFRKLYDFAGLRWTGSTAAMISEDSQGSRTRIEAWRGAAAPEAVQALRRGYQRFALPWYQSDEEW